MYVAGQKEMRQMDQYTIEKIGLPGIVLMENAGSQVVEEIIANSPSQIPRILVLAGGGNNGGDGFVIARRLIDLDMNTLLCLLVKPEKLKGDAKVHFDVYVKRGLPIFFLHENPITMLQKEINGADIIIDAILGTGMKGPVKEPIGQVISLVNEYKENKLIVSVDIPSGVNSETGKVSSVAVMATKTITFVFPKRGFFLNEGPKYVGDWKAVNISVPPEIVNTLELDLPKLITENLVKKALPIRPKHGHKGTFGHALVIGGSTNYVGAPVFSAKAALHSGAGLVTLAIPENIYPQASVLCPESLFLPLPEKEGHFAPDAVKELSFQLDQFESIAIGPGIGRFQLGEEWMRNLFIHLTNQPIVIDADGLYMVRNDLDRFRGYKGSVIFTPHPGEMARLLSKTVKEIEEDRIEIAKAFAKEYKIFLLLKGHRTIIASPDGSVYINPFGHDALGKGGSGDVLTGIIASFLAQGASPINALISASYLHARAGEEKAKTLSHYGVMPVDIIEGVREQLRHLG